MAKTFKDMVGEAQSEVQSVTPAEAKARIDSDENLLVIDVRDAADIASLTSFLLSDEAGWITGQTFGVDGGRSTLR